MTWSKMKLVRVLALLASQAAASLSSSKGLPHKRDLSLSTIPASSLYNTSTCSWGTYCDPNYGSGYSLCPDTGIMCGRLSNFTTSTFLTAVGKHCEAFLGPLQDCSEDYSLRSASADVWALCVTKLFNEMWSAPSNNHGGPIAFDTRPESFDKINYVKETSSGTCSKPDSGFLPILKQACSSQFAALEEVTTNHKFRSTGSNAEEESVLYCQVEAAIHYTRCTQWPPDTNTSVLSCVQDVTSRLDWVDYALLTDNGNDKCPNPTDMIRRLVVYNIVYLVLFLFFASRRLLLAVFGRNKIPLREDRLVETNYWTWFLSLAFHIGCTVGTAILTLGNGRNTAALPPDASLRIDIGIWQTMEIWALRPRIAGVMGLIGLVHRGYTGRALRAMFVNMLMCFLGVVWSGNLAFGRADKPSPSGGPPDGWLAMTKGGLAAVIAQMIFVAIGILLMCGGKGFRACMDKAKQWNEKRHPEQSRKCGFSRREFGKLDWTVYVIFALLSLWLYAASWAMWVGFLKVYGPLYCPSSLRQVDLMWCLGGLGMELVSLVIDLFSIGNPAPPANLPDSKVSSGDGGGGNGQSLGTPGSISQYPAQVTPYYPSQQYPVQQSPYYPSVYYPAQDGPYYPWPYNTTQAH